MNVGKIFSKPTVYTQFPRTTGQDSKYKQIRYKHDKNSEFKFEETKKTPQEIKFDQSEAKTETSWKTMGPGISKLLFSQNETTHLGSTSAVNLNPVIQESLDKLTAALSELQQLKTSNKDKDQKIKNLESENKKLKEDLTTISTVTNQYKNEGSGLILTSKNIAKFCGTQAVGGVIGNIGVAVALLALGLLFGPTFLQNLYEEIADKASGPTADIEKEAYLKTLDSHMVDAKGRVEKLAKKQEKVEILEKEMVKHPADRDLQNNRHELHIETKNVERNIAKLTEKYRNDLLASGKEKIETNQSLQKNKQKVEVLRSNYNHALDKEMKKLDASIVKAGFSMFAVIKGNIAKDYKNISSKLTETDRVEIKSLFYEVNAIIPTDKKSLKETEVAINRLQEKINSVRPNANAAIDAENKGLLASILSIFG